MNDSLKLNMCQICMEDKNEVKQLKHINPIGDISLHKMCDDCYKCLKTQICPFCNGKIVKEIKKINFNIWTDINWGLAEMCLPQPNFAT